MPTPSAPPDRELRKAKRPSPRTPANSAFLGDVTLEHENPDEFADLYAAYLADYRPTPGIETELVRQLAVATLRLHRLERIETAAMFSDAPAATRHEANVIIEHTFRDRWDTLEKILKARTAAERSFQRVYQDLETRRKNRTAPRPAPKVLEIERDTRHAPIPQNKPSRANPNPTEQCCPNPAANCDPTSRAYNPKDPKPQEDTEISRALSNLF